MDSLRDEIEPKVVVRVAMGEAFEANSDDKDELVLSEDEF